MEQSGILTIHREHGSLASLQQTLASIRGACQVENKLLRLSEELSSPVVRAATAVGAVSAVHAWTKVHDGMRLAEGVSALRGALRASLVVEHRASGILKSAHEAIEASAGVRASPYLSAYLRATPSGSGLASVVTGMLSRNEPLVGECQLGILRPASISFSGVAEGRLRALAGLTDPLLESVVRSSQIERIARMPAQPAATSAMYLGLGSLAVAATPMLSGPTVGVMRTPSLRIDAILKHAPSTSDIASAVDALFDVMDSVANHAGIASRQRAQADEPRREQGDEHKRTGESRAPARESRASRIWTPGAPSILSPHVPLTPVPFFLGASPADDEHREKLMKHLTALIAKGHIRPWSEADIQPGEDAATVTARWLAISKFILLLLSADYLSELYARGMMRHLEARSPHATIIPVLVRPVDIEDTPFQTLSPLPSGGRFITTWNNPDEAWLHVARAVRGVVESYRRGATALSQ